MLIITSNKLKISIVLQFSLPRTSSTDHLMFLLLSLTHLFTGYVVPTLRMTQYLSSLAKSLL